MAISRCFVFSLPFAQDTSFFDFDNEKGGIGIAELEARLGKDVDECTHVMLLLCIIIYFFKCHVHPFVKTLNLCLMNTIIHVNLYNISPDLPSKKGRH
jgi:hypothetical protein